MLMCFLPVNWENLSSAVLHRDCSTIEVTLRDADRVSNADQNDAVARLGLESDLILDPSDSSLNSSLDHGCDPGYGLLRGHFHNYCQERNLVLRCASLNVISFCTWPANRGTNSFRDISARFSLELQCRINGDY